MHVMRILIQGLIVGAIVFGVVSALLRKKKVLPLSGMLLAFAAILFGGASVPINQTLHDGPAIGLDWFLLDLLMMALIYVSTSASGRSIPSRARSARNGRWMSLTFCRPICRCRSSRS